MLPRAARRGVAALLLALVLPASADHETETSIPNDKAQEAINDLRRQLIENNSEYSLEHTNDTDEIRPRANSEAGAPRHNYNNNYYLLKDKDDNSVERIDHVGEKGESRDIKKPEHRVPVAEKDLLYYIDDENLTRKRTGKDNDKKNYKNNNGTDVKYKMLKVRHQYRRKQPTRYIQEEGKQGVAIVSLDRAPFPELRLSAARRQYRHDHGAASSEDEELEEVAPPPLNTSDPEAAVEDVEPPETQRTAAGQE